MSISNVEVGIDSFTDLATINAALFPGSSSTAATKALFENGANLNGEICRTKVEARILELENEVRALKSCLNMATVTGRLPPEILSHIFLKLSSSAPTTGSVSQQLSWIRLTHVCRHWRAVALNCPALWSNIGIAHEVWTDLMLSRSKEALLAVDLHVQNTRCGTKVFKALLSKIFSHPIRLRSLKLCIAEGDILLNFPATVPNLRTLVLTSTSPYSTRVPLPVQILAGDAPDLEHLEVRGFTFPWHVLPSAPKLTSLKLIQLPNAGRLSSETLAETIGQMPSLQAFDIRNFLPLGPAPPVPVQFPSLRSLTLVDELSALCNFLQSCAPFQPETIDLQLTGTFPAIEAIGTIFTTLATRWKNPATGTDQWAGTGIQALHLKGMDEDNRKLLLEAHYQVYDPKKKVEPDLRISLPVAKPLVPKVLSTFADSFNISTIQWLTIGLRDDCLGKSWKYIATFGSLETLFFSGGEAILGFVSAMGENWAKPFFSAKSHRSSGSKRSRKKTLFPVLSTIKCRDVDFDLDRQKLADENVMELAMLLKRWPNSHPLRELHLDLCINFTSDDYDCLQEEAPTLTIKWDGVEDIPSDTDDEEDMYDEFMMYHDAFDDYGYDSDYF